VGFFKSFPIFRGIEGVLKKLLLMLLLPKLLAIRTVKLLKISSNLQSCTNNPRLCDLLLQKRNKPLASITNLAAKRKKPNVSRSFYPHPWPINTILSLSLYLNFHSQLGCLERSKKKGKRNMGNISFKIKFTLKVNEYINTFSLVKVNNSRYP